VQSYGILEIEILRYNVNVDVAQLAAGESGTAARF